VKNKIKMASTLSKQEIEQFFNLHQKLILFANRRRKIFEDVENIEDLTNKGMEVIMKLRDVIIKEPNLITSFISENPDLLSKEELNIIEDWKKGFEGEFLIVKYDKDYTIFYHPENKKCYGVVHLFESFEKMLGPYLPIMVKAWLIPYKGKIIYDSFIVPYNISFGRNYRSGVKSKYEETIVKKGIITSFDENSEGSEDKVNNENPKDKDAELLRFYLKSEANRDRYWEEIEVFRQKSPELQIIFSQEWGKINSRYIKKRIKKKNIKGHFAVLEDVIVATDISKKKLIKNLNKILDNEEQIKSVHIFKN